MSVKDITPDAVLAAVRAGHDNVFKLAEHFGVMHVSHTLRSTLKRLADTGEVTRWVERDGTYTFEVNG